LIYSWSVFEHIEQPLIGIITRQWKDLLGVNGKLFMQTTPLYYSAGGSHLLPKIPIPWGHLLMQESIYFSRLKEKCKTESEYKELLYVYQTLNKITADEIIQAFEEAGLHILRKYVTTVSYEIPDILKKIFNEDVLKTEQLVLLAE
jgi:hypothetical protein